MSNMTSHTWRGALLVLVALTALGTVGCRRRGLQRGLAGRYQRNLVRLAARDTGCAAQQLQPTQIGSQPDVFAVTGCTFPVEYWLRCRRGRRGRCRWSRVPTLNEQAAAPLQCQPQMIQQQFTQAPNMRIAVGCGHQATFAMACNGSACGWAMTGPAQAPPPAATAAVPAPPGGPDTVPPPPAGGSDGNAVAMQLQAQREAILSCLDSPNVTLNIRWTADGVIQVQLPPELAGSAAEGCVQAALSTLRITASQPGQLTVPVQ